MSFSKDGRLLAYAISQSGSDWMDWRVIDTTTGVHREDHLRWTKLTSPASSRQSRGFARATQSPRVSARTRRAIER
jgi:prolyl oligopeptidase